MKLHILLAPLLAPLLAAACVSAPPRAGLARPTPVFDPAIFFAGRTEGEGRLRIALRHAKAVRVHGRGHSSPDGTLVLDQTVEPEGDKPTTRQWRLRQTAPGRWQGTLSDAAGPVLATVQGNALHITFPMKGGLEAEQWLYLTPDGQTARNRMTVHKFGAGVAALSETIRRTG